MVPLTIYAEDTCMSSLGIWKRVSYRCAKMCQIIKFHPGGQRVQKIYFYQTKVLIFWTCLININFSPRDQLMNKIILLTMNGWNLMFILRPINSAWFKIFKTSSYIFTKAITSLDKYFSRNAHRVLVIDFWI